MFSSDCAAIVREQTTFRHVCQSRRQCVCWPECVKERRVFAHRVLRARPTAHARYRVWQCIEVNHQIKYSHKLFSAQTIFSVAMPVYPVFKKKLFLNPETEFSKSHAYTAHRHHTT